MNVSCPQCKTVFRVDPRKVPADATRARCSVCGGVFEVIADDDNAKRPAPAGATAASATAGAGAALGTGEVGGRIGAESAPSVSPPPAPEPAVEPAAATPPEFLEEAAAPMFEPSPPSPPPPPPPPTLEATPTPSPEPSVPHPSVSAGSFGEPEPGARARRLARALISDLAVYNPDRQEIGLREGRLKELFRDELKKSWEEYVEQVGLETARATPHFRDALNDILAKGKKVF